MKKHFVTLCSLIAVLLLLSCHSSSNKEKEEKEDPIAQLENIIDDLKDSDEKWDEDQWESFIRDIYDIELSFWESEPSNEEIEEFDKVERKLTNVIDHLSSSGNSSEAILTALANLERELDFDKLSKLEEKGRKAAKKADGDNDEDEEDY